MKSTAVLCWFWISERRRPTTSLQRTEDSVSASPHPAFEFLQRRCGRIRRACRRLKSKSQIPFWRGKRFPVCRQVWFTDRSVRPNISLIRSKKETGITDLKVVATGGLGRIIADETDTIDIYDSALTLDGLRILYEKNCSGK